MRQIEVSTDVFAAIWAARRGDENSEDEILRRKFDISSQATNVKPEGSPKIGFSDPRFGIELEEGFEIFRVYLGREYRAKAVNGAWKLSSDGNSYPSLNQLSRAIGTKGENAWSNWYYSDSSGERHLVTKLRK